MKRNYHTITKIGQANAGRLTEFLSRNGQALLPMVDLIEQSRLAVSPSKKSSVSRRRNHCDRPLVLSWRLAGRLPTVSGPCPVKSASTEQE